MSDINSVKTQIQSLIDLANETTGNQDTNLTDCVNALIRGYGQGGSEEGGGSSSGASDTYADQLYEFYGIDKTVYPYVMFIYGASDSKNSYFYFAKSKNEYGTKLYDCMYRNWLGFNKQVKESVDDVESMVNTIVGNFSTSGTWKTEATSSISFPDEYDSYYYVNFEISRTKSNVYRLDE